MPAQAANATADASRRRFLKTAAAAGVASAAPYVVPPTVFGANAPSNRVELACLGPGTQGMPVMQRILGMPS